MKRPRLQSGVTLLELTVVMTIFLLILSLAYQGSQQFRSAYRVIEQAAQEQSESLIAHKSLKAALNSRARVTGDSSSIILDLKDADHTYFPDHDFQTFSIVDGNLLFSFGPHTDPTVLLENLEMAKFVYMTDGFENQSWQSQFAPDLVKLTGSIKGEYFSWSFSSQ